MNVLLLDDEFQEVSSILSYFSRNDIKCNHLTTFNEAYTVLCDPAVKYDLLITDLMVPWGDEELEVCAERCGLPWKESGMVLAHLLKDKRNDKYNEFIAELPNKFNPSYKEIPIIVFSKVTEYHLNALANIPGTVVLPKLSLSFTMFDNLVKKIGNDIKTE